MFVGKLILLLALLSATVFHASAAETLKVFRIANPFGVPHPDQIVEIRYTNNAPHWWTNAYLLGPDGTTEMAFQANTHKSNTLLVRADLPASVTNTWTLLAGRPAAAFAMPNPVTIATNAHYYEIANGLTGVRIIREPELLVLPLTSLVVSGGTCRITTSQKHRLETICANDPLTEPMNTADCLQYGRQKIGFAEVGAPLDYLNGKWFDAGWPDYLKLSMYRPDTWANNLTAIGVEGSNGQFSGGKLLVTNTASAPIIGIQLADGRWAADNTLVFNNNNNFGNTMKFATAIRTRLLESGPLRAVVAVEYVYSKTSGKVAPRTNTFVVTMEAGQPSILVRAVTDVGINIWWDFFSVAHFNEQQYRWRQVGSGLTDITNTLAGDYPVARWSYWSEPYYRFMYNKSDDRPGPVVGIFDGPASDYLNAQYCIFSLYGSSKSNGIHFASIAQHIVNFGIYVGTKANSLSTNVTQRIGLQRNLHSVFNLSKFGRITWDFDNPPGGYLGLYQDGAILSNMVARLRAGDVSYGKYLKSKDPYASSLIEAWQDKTGQTTHLAAGVLASDASNWVRRLVWGAGNMHGGFHHHEGLFNMARQIPGIVTVLMDPLVTSADAAKAKGAGALYGAIAMDNDFSPIDGWMTNGLNLGTANMPQQVLGIRKQFALALPCQPELLLFLDQAKVDTLSAFDGLLNESGAAFGTTHYLSSSIHPNLVAALQLRMLDASKDPFALKPRLADFAEFHMNLFTPPEPRFGNLRKLTPNGDGSTESSPLPGLLCSGFAKVNPPLARRLAWMWNASGRMQDSFYGTTLVMTDEQYPQQDAQLLSGAWFPGYMTVLRKAWNTPRETTIWLWAGDWLRDHRTDNKGALTLYALGSPLSVGWGCMYSPHIYNHALQSGVLPEADFPNWTKGNQPLEAGSKWNSSANTLFCDFATSSLAEGRMGHQNGLKWHRTTRLLAADATMPIIVVKDQITGSSGKDTPLVATWSLMATGSASTPVGNYVVPSASWWANLSVTQGPSAGTTFTLGLGLAAFNFNGYTWNAHTTKGIDFAVCVLGGTHFNIGNWGHNWHPSTEASQFLSANGRNFEERQHLLRVRSPGCLRTVIVPWMKGRKPANYAVKQVGELIVVTANESKTTIHDDWYAYGSPQQRVLAAFTAKPVTFEDLSVSGGPTEVILQSERAIVTAHGDRGPRQVKIPTVFKKRILQSEPAIAVLNLGELTLNYDSTDPVTVILE